MLKSHKMSNREITLNLFRETEEVKWCPVEGSKIVEFYKNKNVFVTGATGFLGKLLVEKLLRACPDINAVYILVRPKKGEDELSRVDKLYSDQIFRPLSKLFPKFQHKINIIKGDISLPDLGLSPSNISLITSQINVIFHIAATVRFDEKLNVATAINVRGTRDLIEIAKQCKNLDAFVYTSTAFANTNHEEIDEIFYKPSITGDKLIELTEKTAEKVLCEKTPEIIKGWPNTYTFTKAVAEEIVKSHGRGLPICMVRPAIVMATYKEPLRSWIDNLYGATGIIVGAGTGLLKTMHCNIDMTAELVPGDYVINHMITASYHTAIEKDLEKTPIYNYVSSVESRQTWYDMMSLSRKWGEEIAPIRCIWCYCLTLNRYYAVHLLYSLFVHFLPALLMDAGMVLTGNRPIMMKIYKKIIKFESVISHFATHEWKFYNDNTQKLWNSISGPDQTMFPFSMRNFDWEDYHKTHTLGLRTYILKDDPSTIPQALVRWKRFYMMHYTIKALFYLLIFYVLYSVLSRFV